MAEISILIFVAIIPLVAYALVTSFTLLNLPDQSFHFFFLLYFVFLVILWNVGFVMWTDHYLDMWILTDKRLIDVEQRGLFSREVSSLRLDKIQDMKLEVLGLVNTFVGMGSIHVQTAGSEKEFVIKNTKNPEQIKELILSAHNKQIEEVKTVRIENNPEAVTAQ